MAEPLVTDEDREKAAEVLAAILEEDDTQFSSLTLIARAIAAERHRAILQERTREWHEAGPDSPIAWRSLPEHLGMTMDEYNRWVEGTRPAELPG